MRVAVLYNQDASLSDGEAIDGIAVRAVEGAARDVATAIADNGWAAELVAVRDEPRETLAMLAELRADVAFNLVESFGGDPRLEAAFCGALEISGLAYTGSSPRTLAISLDKPLTRLVLEAHGVRVPRAAVLERGDEPLARLSYPVIVKPSREDASHGIERASVARTERDARARAQWVIEHYRQPALVEEYVDGRELNLALLGEGTGAEILSFGEIDFSRMPAGAPKIVTYAGKWIDGSEDWNATVSGAAKPLSERERSELERAARGAYSALDVRDYGRVDLRLNARGEAFVIDVNPNPDLSPDAGLALAAQRSGITHAQLVARIVASARARASARIA
jgi:D-alanine-D-alanine ligase